MTTQLPHAESVIRVERAARTAVVTLVRPQRANALSAQLVDELAAAFDTLDGDSDLRCVVVAASGETSFCAGADLQERRSMSPAQVVEFLGRLNGVLRRIDQFRVPVIAAVQGAARGGGLELALACDIRIASASASFALPEVTLGIIPGAGGTQRLVQTVGVARAKELIITGRVIDAHEAHRIGLVHSVCENQGALMAAMEYATKHFENCAPIAVQAALQAVDGAWGRTIEEGSSIESECYERTLQSRDRVEALEAFAQKRAPRFTGE